MENFEIWARFVEIEIDFKDDVAEIYDAVKLNNCSVSTVPQPSVPAHLFFLRLIFVVYTRGILRTLSNCQSSKTR